MWKHKSYKHVVNIMKLFKEKWSIYLILYYKFEFIIFCSENFKRHIYVCTNMERNNIDKYYIVYFLKVIHSDSTKIIFTSQKIQYYIQFICLSWKFQYIICMLINCKFCKSFICIKQLYFPVGLRRENKFC